jgi:hypothetical protein
MRNVRAPSSILLVSFWNDIYGIKNYIYVLLDDMDTIITEGIERKETEFTWFSL